MKIQLYLIYSSVDYKDFKNIMKLFKKFTYNPNEITILTYLCFKVLYLLRLKSNDKINSINDFMFKNKIKGKIGTFSFKDRKVIQELDIYKTDKNKFIKF